MHRTLRDSPVRQFLDWPYAVEQPIAPAFGRWAAGTETARTWDDDQLLAARLVRAEDVLQETQGQPGAEDPASIVLWQQRGLRRARLVDTAQAALVGACDGEVALGPLLDALATLLEEPGPELRARTLPVVRELLTEGFLETR